MKIRFFLDWFSIAIGLLLTIGGNTSAAETGRRPNVIILLADDLGYGDLACFGHPKFKTPNLDRMAAEGARLTQFNTPAPFCAPTRASLMTGRYPFRCGLTANPAPDFGGQFTELGLPTSEITLAQLFHGAGYATGMVGKWHLGHAKKEFYPVRRGFDEYLGILYSNDMRPVQLIDGEKVVEYPVVQATLTKRYTDRALKFIEKNKDKPFFLYFAHAMPHKPLAASEKYYQKSGAGLYGDVISELDASVGRVLAKLKELKLDDNTLVVFTSDNGPWFGGSTGGLRGMKGTSWEGGYRVPFIARWPGAIPAGHVSSEPAVTMDLFATALKVGGIAAPSGRVIDGADIRPLLTSDAKSPHDVIVGCQGPRLATARDARWKLHVLAPNDRMIKAGPNGKWVDPRAPDGVTILAPYEQYPTSDFPGVSTGDASRAMALFDLLADPAEQHNVAAANPDVVKRLKAKFDAVANDVPEVDKSSASQSSVGAEKPTQAFPGAVGQGAVAVGGRGGDVYHVVNLQDYDPKKGEAVVAGSLRDAISSAQGPRTIVFDIGGGIKLHETLTVDCSKLTIAGQTAPGGITLWGYPLQIDGASDVIIRSIRVRTGDFNARAPKGNDSLHGKGAMDLDAPSANGIGVIHSSRIILDHVSTAWGMDETLSVTHSRAVTVQHSIVAECLDRSFHPKGPHGYGSLIRGEITPADQDKGVGGYTLYGNLWALNRARNPSVGGEQTLKPNQSESDRRRADVNIVNNVIYGWSDRPTHRNDFGRIRLNFVGNYFVNGPANKSPFIFVDHNPAPTIIYQDGNMLDANLNRELDGKIVGRPSDIPETFRGIDENDQLFGPPQGKPLNFFRTVAANVVPAEQAYERVIRSVGDSLQRDAIDRRIIEFVVTRTGRPIDSQEVYRDAHGVLPGIDDLGVARRPMGFDSDEDGIPDEFEKAHGLNAHNPDDRNRSNLSNAGYTNLEVYLDSLIQNATGS